MRNIARQNKGPSLLELCDAISDFRMSEEMLNAGLTVKEVLASRNYLKSTLKHSKENPLYVTPKNYDAKNSIRNYAHNQPLKPIKPLKIVRRVPRERFSEKVENKSNVSLAIIVNKKQIDSDATASTVSSNKSSRNSMHSHIQLDSLDHLKNSSSSEEISFRKYKAPLFNTVKFPSVDSLSSKRFNNDTVNGSHNFEDVQNKVYIKMTKNMTPFDTVLIEQTSGGFFPPIRFLSPVKKERTKVEKSIITQQMPRNSRPNGWEYIDLSLYRDSPTTPNPSICTMLND